MNELEKQKMSNYLSSAAKIIAKTEGSNGRKKTYNGQINESYGQSDFVDQGAIFEQQILNSYEPAPTPINNGSIRPGASKLPKEILESVMSNPISDYNSTSGLSVLDSLPTQQIQRQPMNENYYPGEKEIPSTEELLARSRALHEQKQPRPQPQQPVYQSQQAYQPQIQPSSGGIDYSMIRIIIEECISRQLSELKKTMLSESVNTGTKGDVILTIGDNIKFIAKNGNVYEGVVKKVGNINSQK